MYANSKIPDPTFLWIVLECQQTHHCGFDVLDHVTKINIIFASRGCGIVTNKKT